MSKITVDQIVSLGADLDRTIRAFARLPTLDPVTSASLREERAVLHECFEWLKVRTPEKMLPALQEIIHKFQALDEIIYTKSHFSEKN